MVQLFLSEPDWNIDGDDEAVKQKISLLNELESIIWSLISSGGRSEARLWLCRSLSSISSITPRHKRELFVNLLRSRPLNEGLAAQLLRMIFEKQPQKTGPIIAKKSYMLEDFFRGNPRRIMLWFANFVGSGDLEHKRGAKALSQYAFINRDICWEELEWKGKHGQSPAMVATKPHYFLDLDVQRTVENFLDYVPEFWLSDEFAESLKDGEILFTDTKFFVDMFVDLMYKDDLKEVWELVGEFLREEPFTSLCHHLLIVLDERELCSFLKLIREFINPKIEPMGFGNPSYCLEVILSKCSNSDSIDELLLLNAVTSQQRQLLRLLQEEAHKEEKVKIIDFALQICTSSSHANGLMSLMEEFIKKKSIKSIKWLGLQSWAIHYVLAEEGRSSESWESLFISNGLSFRQSDKHPLLRYNGFLEESESDLDVRGSVRLKRKKKEKRRKKRRRNCSHDDSYNDELLDFDSSNNRLALQSKAGGWLLSTDGYSTAWSSVDLPEHLSRHCFSTWMKWIFTKWGDFA